MFFVIKWTCKTFNRVLYNWLTWIAYARNNKYRCIMNKLERERRMCIAYIWEHTYKIHTMRTAVGGKSNMFKYVCIWTNLHRILIPLFRQQLKYLVEQGNARWVYAILDEQHLHAKIHSIKYLAHGFHTFQLTSHDLNNLFGFVFMGGRKEKIE